MLKEVTLGHTVGPFRIPPFPNLQVYPIGVIPKKHSVEWYAPPVSMPTFLPNPILCNM